jgi:hypothetical protein
MLQQQKTKNHQKNNNLKKKMNEREIAGNFLPALPSKSTDPDDPVDKQAEEDSKY